MHKIILSAGIACIALAVFLAIYLLRDGDTEAPPPSPAAASSSGSQPEYQAGPFQFDIAVNPETPRVGANTLTLTLVDMQGQPVSDASISAVAEMPAMGSMPAMRAPADMQEEAPGVYRGKFKPSMEGAWPLTLQIAKSGLGEQRVSFDLATGRKGLQLASGARSVSGTQAPAEALPAGTVTLDSRRRQLIGIKTDFATQRQMQRTLRAVGQVDYDETRLVDVSLKFDGWIGQLHADFVGAQVVKGEPLFTVYSPDLLAAQQEYLELKSRGAASAPLLNAARQRLALWNMETQEIAELERRGRPIEYVTVRAPASGTVINKNVVEGTAHKAGTTLLRIADLSRVWVEADVYEADLALVSEGMPAQVSLSYLPGYSAAGTVAFVYPYLDTQTRTGRVRVVLENSDGVLKPAMYAEVRLSADLGSRLTVPEEAVIVAGDKRFVFEDLGDGALAPRRVRTGNQAGGLVEIVDGLEDGDCVVTSGNFLIASESRLKSGLDQW